MKINRHELEEMNDMVEKGATIADVAKEFNNYGYWDIYYAVEDYSLLGKKRSITNRLNKLQNNLTEKDQKKLVEEIKELLNEIYETSKRNGKKLINISKILTK